MLYVLTISIKRYPLEIGVYSTEQKMITACNEYCLNYLKGYDEIVDLNKKGVDPKYFSGFKQIVNLKNLEILDEYKSSKELFDVWNCIADIGIEDAACELDKPL
jgi:hypothetical protein